MPWDDDLKTLMFQLRLARLRLQTAVQRARAVNARHGHADRLAELRQLHRRTETIRAQSERLRSARRTVH